MEKQVHASGYGPPQTGNVSEGSNSVNRYADLGAAGGASQVALAVKSPPASAGDRETGSAPCQKAGTAPHSSTAWKTPWDRGAGRATVHGVTESLTGREATSQEGGAV